jgi:carboxypeptidase Taq
MMMANEPANTTDIPLTRAATREAYEALIAHVREASLLGSTGSLLSWDQETLMPPAATAHRAQQLALIAKLVHQRVTDPRLGDWLACCEADSELVTAPHSVVATNVRELRRGYDRATRLPVKLVEALSRSVSLGRESWKAARAARQFATFAPALRELVDLQREKAACYGWAAGGEAWDALAEGYEPGSTAAAIEAVFEPLRARLVPLIERLLGSTTRPSAQFKQRVLPQDGQRRFVERVLRAFGFDFTRGRLDLSTHPFCGGTHCNDVRMTTRFGDADFPDKALGSSMHECGHGLYEQGLLAEHIGTPMGSAISLGIHESQSRMWENQVGRSAGFWTWARPLMVATFGSTVDDLQAAEMYAGANQVARSPIRVEADEATYNLHVMLRFALERALIAGTLAVDDLPQAWNERMRRDLDVTVTDDAEGCLQDIHWSMGLFGYFPTYTLGNLYAAQFFDAAQTELGDLQADFREGRFMPLREWLRERIHVHGRRYRAAELCTLVTHRPLSSDPLLAHLERKLLPLYGL